MQKTTPLLLSALMLASGAALAQEKNPELRVVATIKPLHSLAAGVMEGVGEPVLLIEGATNPHDYRMRPSEAESLQNADILFWIGAGFEGGNIASVAENARIVTLTEEGEHHDEHGDHDEHEHDEHEHGHDEHGHDERDLHIWLDPHEAEEIVESMVDALTHVDPNNAATYHANGKTLLDRLHRLDGSLRRRIKPLQESGSYIVFHDAYNHFEARYGLRSRGALLSGDAHGHEHGPSAHRLTELREELLESDSDIRCVFVEPAFESASAGVLVEGSDASIVVLDPLGAELPADVDAYFLLMENLAASFEECLGAS